MDKFIKCSSCLFILVSSILFVSYVAADKGACVRNPGPIAQLCSRSNVTGSTVSVDASLFKDSGRTRCSCKLTVSSPEVLVVTTSSPGFMQCGTALELIIGEDRKDFGCAMATHTSTRGEGSITILNSTQNILASDYCVLFQVREGEVSLVCEDQQPDPSMSTTVAESNMATTDTGSVVPSSTESTNATMHSGTETNTKITTTTTPNETKDTSFTNQTSTLSTKSGTNATVFENIGNRTASELKRLFANTQISEDKMSGFLNKYPDLRELIIEPVTPEDLLDNSTKGLFAEFARESFTDTHGRLQPEVTTPLVLLTEKQPVSTALPTEQTTRLPTTTIVLDQPIADKNTILDKYPEINETVIEPVPEGLLDLIKPIEDAILPKTTVTPDGESTSTGSGVNTSAGMPSSPVSTVTSVDGVSTEVPSTSVKVDNLTKDSEARNGSSLLDLLTSTPIPSNVDLTTTETAVNKSIILEKHSGISNVIIEPVPHENFTSFQNESTTVSKTSSTSLSDISTAGVATDIPVVNKSAILEKLSDLSNVTFEPVSHESSTLFLNESTTETVDSSTVTKTAILEKHSDLSNVTFEPVSPESSTLLSNESTTETTDVSTVNKSAILEKHSELSNVTFEPVSLESSTVFSNESTAETSDVAIVNKSAILEKHSGLSNVTFEPVSHESSTLFSNESTTETSDLPAVNKSAVLEKNSNTSDVIIEPVTEETFLLLKNQTTSGFNPSEVTTDSMLLGESDIMSTTDIPGVNKSIILEKHSNFSDVLIEPATEETLALLQNGTTSMPDSFLKTESSTWKKNISDEMTDTSIVNKSSILEKYSNLSDITIEPATYENFTFPKQNQSTTAFNTAKLIKDRTTPLLPASGLPYNKSTDSHDLTYPITSTTESTIGNNISSTKSLEHDALSLTNASQPFDTSSLTKNDSASEFTTSSIIQETSTRKMSSDFPPMKNLVELSTRKPSTESLSETNNKTGVLLGGSTITDDKHRGDIPISDTPLVTDSQYPTEAPIKLVTHMSPKSTEGASQYPTEAPIKLVTHMGPKSTEGASQYPTEAPIKLVTHMGPKSTEGASQYPTEAPIKLVTHMGPKSTESGASQYPTEAPIKLVTHMGPKSTESGASQYPTEAPIKLVTHMDPKSTEGAGQYPTEAPIKLVTHMGPKSTEGGVSQYPTEAPIKLVTHMGPKSTESGASQYPTEAPIKLVTHMGPKSSTDRAGQHPTKAPSKVVTHTVTEDTNGFPNESPIKLGSNIAPKSTEETTQSPTEAPVKLVTHMAPKSTPRNTDTTGMDASTEKSLSTSNIISTLRPVSDPITTGGIDKSTQKVTETPTADKTTATERKTTSATSNIITTDKILNTTDTAGVRTTTKPSRNSTDVTSRNRTSGSVNANKTGDAEDSFYLNNHTITIIIIGSVIGVLVIIAIIVIIASFMKSRRRSANITGFEKDGMELNGGGIDNPLVQLEQERQLVETNPNPALNGSMDFTIIPSSSGVNETSQTTLHTSETNNGTNPP